MARSLFGVTPGETILGFTPSTTDDPKAVGVVTGATLQIWSFDRDTQYTDLLAANPTNPTSQGSGITVVTAAAPLGRTAFWGPNNVNGALWGFDGTNWWLFQPADLANRIPLTGPAGPAGPAGATGPAGLNAADDPNFAKSVLTAMAATTRSSECIISYGSSPVPLRATGTADTSRPVRWRGTTEPPATAGYALSIDVWDDLSGN